ncbi:Rne/Rng family ribonuclease [Leptolyngbya sp. 7M]|uniref:Rne/Rng family ribonuclease n=1 Tax=Leptolyngbya sp. 7M TaxID=2812896 RepID=UPI001B8D6939|nr:Rne/Rng family ribonuclease [Leptolyngbya sp. 7M]QYO66047.1 Rne/Rng family ribonuclease [Leptolyngbya sp. 7M]
MSKEMIISVNGREKKIAILDNGKVTEFYIERGEENSGIAGNIYKGRVQRVLPGMQSAFVSIGLERDAFLYVSDFFDEEEEIERIVMERSKKGSKEDAKREANEKIERARIEREKQMESAQEISEPLAELAEPIDEPMPRESKETGKKRSRRGRDRKNTEEEQELTAGETFIEFDDSGFERIVDDEDTGELFKDAYMQEAIVDQVRAVEFDMESIDEAEVGSLLTEVSSEGAAFERIADDEDETEPEKPKKRTTKKAGAATEKRSRTKKKVKPDDETGSDGDAVEAPKKKPTRKKAATTRSKTTKKKDSEDIVAGGSEILPDAEAEVREAPDTSAMSARRGGRGRRRSKAKKDENGNSGEHLLGFDDVIKELEESDKHKDETALNSSVSAEEQDGQQEVTDERSSGESNGRKGSGRNKNRGRERDRNENRNGRGDKRERMPTPTISDLLREGQEILVQIAKEPIAKKGARITSHIALPGRFLVYMPTIEHLGVSRKIESSNERGRLRSLIQRIRAEEDIPSGGFIVRTAGIGISEEDLRQDARYLVRTWQDIKKTSEKAKSPALVHQDLDLVQRLLRDQLSDDFTAIRVDSEEEYLRTVEFINRIQPRMVNRVKFYTREQPILDAYGVQEEIDKALKPRVWLRSGGYLVINQTEALVAIDVNTGKFVGKGNARLEDTITKTNMEAVEEIARQIRLRDLGGIIVLDLIDMEDRRNRHKVSQALQEALASDRSPTKVLSFNDFGLIIMTRKRVKQSLERTMCAPCEYCEGAGWVKSPQTVCYEILAESRRLSKELEDVRQTTLRVHPDVAAALRSTERTVLEEIEAYLENVDLTADPHIHQAQFDFAFV